LPPKKFGAKNKTIRFGGFYEILSKCHFSLFPGKEQNQIFPRKYFSCPYPSVCVPDVIGALACGFQTKKQKLYPKKKPKKIVFVGANREIGEGVALTKEEKRKWKNRQKQSPSIKRPPAGSKTGSRWPKWNSPDCTKNWHGFIFIMGAHCFRVPEHVLIQVASALYRNKLLFYESRIFLSTSC
jgi:hypothetical protein